MRTQDRSEVDAPAPRPTGAQTGAGPFRVVLAVGIAVVLAIIVATVVLWSRRDATGPGVVLPAQPVTDVVNGVSLFVAPSVLPASGGTVVVVLRARDGDFVPLLLDVDRLVDGVWTPVGKASVCYQGCVGQVHGVGEKVLSQAATFEAGPDGVGLAGRVEVHQPPGTYRFVGTLDSFGPGVRGPAASFEIAADPQAPGTTPVLDLARPSLDVRPALVAGGANLQGVINIVGVDTIDECAPLITGGWRLERWDGRSWTDRAAFTPLSTEACSAQIDVAVPKPGTWRVVRGEIAGYFWAVA